MFFVGIVGWLDVKSRWVVGLWELLVELLDVKSMGWLFQQ